MSNRIDNNSLTLNQCQTIKLLNQALNCALICSLQCASTNNCFDRHVRRVQNCPSTQWPPLVGVHERNGCRLLLHKKAPRAVPHHCCWAAQRPQLIFALFFCMAKPADAAILALSVDCHCTKNKPSDTPILQRATLSNCLLPV